ncbi:sugar nucleotide-binding protein [Halomonas sp. EF61]|uniref:SDR family oxidoreductase n=1 Tax=Halomonas sp. EF61 TaxID=2950869 RepID=UPI0032DF75FD
MKKCLLIGAGGMLGQYFSQCKLLESWEVLFHRGRTGDGLTANLSDIDQTYALLDKVEPNVIVNLVAATNVDECEKDPLYCYEKNVKVINNVVSWIQDKKSCSSPYLLNVSTDQVYERSGLGTVGREADVSPLNYYSYSKLLGECAASSVRGASIRTNFFGKSLHPARKSFSDWVYGRLVSGERFSVFEDVYFSPLSMLTLCRYLALIIEKQPSGVFNLGSRDGFSKAEFARVFAQLLGSSYANMESVSIDSKKGLIAKRPYDMRMDVSKFEDYFSIELPSLLEEVKTVVGDYR